MPEQDHRRNRQTDDELRSLFSGDPPPQLSLDFTRRLRTEVSIERRRMRPRRWRLTVMQVYWFVAALASGWVLMRLQLPLGTLDSPWSLTVAILLGLSIAPAAVLLKGLGMDLFDLLAGTIRGLEPGRRDPVS